MYWTVFVGSFEDDRFPSEKEAEARVAKLKADKVEADVLVATDPDADRMGCAVRNRAGKMELLTGNQIGALLAEYRLSKYKELGWIPAGGSEKVCIIKTFVTTRLQDAIGALRRGAWDFLTKPISIAALQDVLLRTSRAATRQ